MPGLSRRLFVELGSIAGFASVLPTPSWSASASPTAVSAASADPPDALAATFPAQSSALVQEMVGVSHGNFARVRELVEARPALAKAAWDWGFGDWESALDAASHVGNRQIAEFLIAHGARPTPFTLAMLGKLDALKAVIAAVPGVQRTLGPHGINMMSHARSGGSDAAPVVKYLEALGDADPKPPLVPLTDAERAQITGTYVFGPGATDGFDVTDEKNQLGLARTGGTRRILTHLGEFAFYPAGADAVRIRFEVANGRAAALTIHDPNVIVRATRLTV